MRVVAANGQRLATESFGHPGDPAMLLIMGATESMLGWPDDFCTMLAGHGFHVIRYDHRDTGGSTTLPPGTARYTVEDLAADARAVLDGHGLARAHLVGMSLGGYLAQMLAVTDPARVLSLTLIASEPLGWDSPALPHMSDDILAHFGGLATLDWDDLAAVRSFLLRTRELCAGRAYPFDRAAEEDRIDRILARTSSLPSMFNHASLGGEKDWTGRFRDFRCPVLVIHGSDDPVLPSENGQALAGNIPGAMIEVLTGAGHELPAPLLPRIAGRIAHHARQANP
ncbi:alpha/beta fold hydrolase [Halodurantibacterium flavum]|uniref:Alpha/beta fold hydrolase n=1 Tax=Halodurantibacterium flavum TaxID=1382802 RepID=A0ABW4S7R6_9RHOB